jgi:membrane fusion protein, copper/silver efflux system
MRGFTILSLVFACALGGSALQAQTPPRPASALNVHLGVGVVRDVDLRQRTLTISHQEMRSLGMAAMTMDFLVAQTVQLQGVKVGQTVAFMLGADHGNVAVVSLQAVANCREPAGK